MVKKEHGDAMSPLFITCDPARDTPPVVSTPAVSYYPTNLVNWGPQPAWDTSATRRSASGITDRCYR